MNEGLKALEELKECINLEGVLDYINEERINIIEKELKEYEKMKRIKGTTTLDSALEETLIKACPNVSKKLKALEIILKNKMNVELLLLELNMYKDYEEYKDTAYFNNRSLIQEEYNLLKEVLL